MFKSLCESHPGESSFESIGKSYNGLDIWAFKIGSSSSSGVVLWDGCMHGSEDLGSEVEYLLAEWLLESGEDQANRILRNNLIIFIPVVNPDSTRRTNMHTYVSGASPNGMNGVDLNRNFVLDWGINADWEGTNNAGSTNPANPKGNYIGPSAGSEPETKAMRYAFQKLKPKFYVNTHMGGGPWLGYHWRNSNKTWVNIIKTKMRDNQSYNVISCGWGGLAIGDAYYFGANAWLLELTGEKIPSSNEVNDYYLKCKPLLITMAELCEVPTNANTSNHNTSEDIPSINGLNQPVILMSGLIAILSCVILLTSVIRKRFKETRR
jgi:hypothetical protein